MPSTVRLHRVFRAPPERLYRAFLEPEALAKWNAPHGFVARIHEMDVRVGGRYRMSFINFGTGQSHDFGGSYLELVANQRIRSTDTFDDPNLPGTMAMTVTFSAVSCGTRVEIVQEGLPDAVPPEACQLGWQESLSLLARLVEAEIPAGPG
jgi:uncharacterized protein YndB with AHSA1/START domain